MNALQKYWPIDLTELHGNSIVSHRIVLSKRSAISSFYRNDFPDIIMHYYIIKNRFVLWQRDKCKLLFAGTNGCLLSFALQLLLLLCVCVYEFFHIARFDKFISSVVNCKFGSDRLFVFPNKFNQFEFQKSVVNSYLHHQCWVTLEKCLDHVLVGCLVHDLKERNRKIQMELNAN